MRKRRYIGKRWLQSQYVDLQLSTRKIAAKEGVNAETIRQKLIEFNISRRYCTPTGVNYVRLSEEAREFLNGELLGDASIIWGCKPTSAYYSLTSKYEQYLKWIEKQLLSFDIKRRGKLKSYDNKYGTYWLLQSKYYRSEMPELRRLWYPEEKKIIPNTLNLTPLTTKAWFIEDGSAVHSGYSKTISFATNGFSKHGVETLRGKLKEAIGGTININKSNKKGFVILITKKDTIKTFYDYIGDCPKEIEAVYGYKWKLS